MSMLGCIETFYVLHGTTSPADLSEEERCFMSSLEDVSLLSAFGNM